MGVDTTTTTAGRPDARTDYLVTPFDTAVPFTAAFLTANDADTPPLTVLP